MSISGTINIKGFSKEQITKILEGMTSQHESFKIESIRPTEGAISIHVRQEFHDKLDEADFVKAKECLVNAFYREFGHDNVAYDLGYPAS